MDRDLNSMNRCIEHFHDGERFDIVVIGSGCAGMTAALTASIEEARVLLLESTDRIGGTTALSAGTVWIANSRQGATVAPNDSAANALAYLDAVAGDSGKDARRKVFVDRGPEAVDYLEAHSAVVLRPRQFHPDYLSELPGATEGGRALEPPAFDGRVLGELLNAIRPPIPEFTLFGGMMVDKDDIRHLLNLKTSWASLKHSVRLLGRYARDRMSYSRGTRLVMGNGLVARLFKSLIDCDVDIALNAQIKAMSPGSRGIDIVVQQADATRTVFASKVIFASGGFNRHPARRAAMLPGIHAQWCAGAPGHAGAAHDFAMRCGASYGQKGLSHAYWAPVSLRRRKDGSIAVFPHFLFDRGKPGMVIVNGQGQRFASESVSYNLFGLAMQMQRDKDGLQPTYLITDAEGIKRYGLGIARPGGRGLRPLVRDGYLIQENSVDALEQRLNLPVNALVNTITAMNASAKSGVDSEHHRGETSYERANGDATRGLANPCLGPVKQAPFYAVRLYPGDIGAATGFSTDTACRMLDSEGTPLDTFYACGNDMHSLLNGAYAGPGITLGPALTFGYIAGKHAAQSLKEPMPIRSTGKEHYA